MKNRFHFHESPPLHVIGKTHRPAWPLSQLEVWQMFGETIAEFQEDYDLTTHAFVLMKNHYHWLCSFDLKTDPKLFEWFHEVINLSFLHEARLYEDIGFVLPTEPLILSADIFPFYKASYRYVYSNPVKAGIVSDARDYPFSTLSYVLGEEELAFQVVDNMNLIQNPIKTVHWINTGKEFIEEGCEDSR